MCVYIFFSEHLCPFWGASLKFCFYCLFLAIWSNCRFFWHLSCFDLLTFLGLHEFNFLQIWPIIPSGICPSSSIFNYHKLDHLILPHQSLSSVHFPISPLSQIPLGKFLFLSLQSQKFSSAMSGVMLIPSHELFTSVTILSISRSSSGSFFMSSSSLLFSCFSLNLGAYL